MWLKKADEMLQMAYRRPNGGSGAVQFATSMLTALYGPESAQLRQFRDGYQMIVKKAESSGVLDQDVWRHAVAAIQNTKAELESGLIVGLRAVVAGEVLV